MKTKLRNYIVVGRPQLIALALLFCFATFCITVIQRKPFTADEQNHIWSGRQIIAYKAIPRHFQHTPLVNLAAAAPMKFDANRFSDPRQALTQQDVQKEVMRLRWMLRAPFVFAGLILGASIWYVSRRLYGNAGGYIALSLYCFSPVMVLHAASIGEAVPSAWGIFGIIFGGIAISHNLYAPMRKWRYRTVLLSIAATLAIASHPAAMVVFPAALLFMLYLAPGRRWAALLVALVSTVLSAAFVFATYGFYPQALRQGIDLRAWLKYQPEVSRPLFFDVRFLMENFTLAYILLFAVALVSYMLWKRSRYFGNTAPLFTGLCLLYAAMITPLTSIATIWALPFLYVFTGGIWADLLETRHRKWVASALMILLGENAWLCWATIRLALA